MLIERHFPNGRMSQVVARGNDVFLSGQVASNPVADVATQTAQVLAQIDDLLANVGSNRSLMLSATVWLADIRDFAAMNTVWDAWVDPANLPARACIEARLARPELRVEIQVVAQRTTTGESEH